MISYTAKLFRVSCFLPAALILTMSAQAQEVPQSLLMSEKAECKQECSLSGNGVLICETLCGCTIEQFSLLNLAQFQAMKAEMDAENVSSATQSYLANVGAMCVAELDRIVDGVLQPPPP